MKRRLWLALASMFYAGVAWLFLSSPVYPATYYVASSLSSPAGNDANPGTSGAPWLTLARALNPAGSPGIVAGDTVYIVADGNYINCDASLPYLSGTATTTIQSSKIALFSPVGYRTNPAKDITIYGKCHFTSGAGLQALAETHGYPSTFGVYCPFTITPPSDTFTLNCAAGLQNLANGSQLECEINAQVLSPPVGAACPAPLVLGQHYYIVSCGAGCGTNGSTYKLSATAGGSPITITACDSNCASYSNVAEPMQVDTSTSFLASPDPLAGIVNNTPLAFVANGLQLPIGVLPAPLQQDVIYYATNVGGGGNARTLQVSATPGGTPLTLTSIGAGMVSMGTVQVAHNWKFSGIESAPAAGNSLSFLWELGGGAEVSIYGMVNHIEVDRCYFHDNPPNDRLTRAIYENSQFLYVHDSYISGMNLGEAQAISGTGSYGPTAIVNTFLEGAGETILYGGNIPTYPTANQNKTFTGNYFYKPPAWKQTQGSGAPTGPCWYDNYDPQHSGGEWFRDTMAGQNSQCGADFLWHTTGSALPASYTVKTMFEFKNLRNASVIGNAFNYNWVSGQSGQALSFHQAAGGPMMGNDHITAMLNKAANVYNFVTQESSCFVPSVQGCAALPANHVIANNLALISLNACGVYTVAGTCGANLTTHNWDGYPESGELWNHNTVVAPDTIAGPVSATNFTTYLGGCGPFSPVLDSWIIKNGIYTFDMTGVCSNGTATMQNLFTNSAWSRLVLSKSSAGVHYTAPGGSNTIDHIAQQTAGNASIGYVALPPDYVNVAGTDAHLAASSPFSAACPSGCQFVSDDGTDPGADIDAVNMATSGAVSGTPPWSAGLRISLGSGNVVFRYKAPTPEIYTVTIYSAGTPVIPRIPANQVAAKADSDATAISDGSSREVPIATAAMTNYAYRVANASGSVSMVGTFTTLGTGSGSYPFTFDWPAATAMSYSVNADMSSPTNLGAATRQVVPVGANSLIYAAPANLPPTILVTP